MEGLTSREARRRLKQYGPNSLKAPKKGRGLALFLVQFKSPLILLLMGAAILSYFLGGRTDSIIILTIVFLSGALGFIQERGALNALEKLLQIVETKITVLRDGKEARLPIENIVPGDVVHLRAGDLVPADCTLIETNHFFVDEAALTGESLPVEKTPSANPSIFLGTMVASGMATASVKATGKNTEYSHIIEHVRFRPPETAFEIGVRKFGYFLLEVTLVLVIIIFVINILLHKPIIESFLFSLAIAVGLTPQLLPAIITVNLSHGARRMAEKRVIVKRLPSIENFGQMDIFCADKTGTLTQGKIRLDRAAGIDGKKCVKAALYGFLNAHFQAGYSNPLDQAILDGEKFDVSQWKKVREIPYDFVRKRLSVICSYQNHKVLIAKGAVPQMLSICTSVELSDGTVAPLEKHIKEIEDYFDAESKKGFRTLALAYGENHQEKNLTLLGFLHFFDPIKPDIVDVISDLKSKGVSLKIITGDHRSVAAYVASSLGMNHDSLITGPEIRKMSDQALMKAAKETKVFAEIEPNQKERIILSLRKSGHIVGFMGDGVNDVSAIHSADVGIAVDSGADAAKEAADIVLLEKNLSVLRNGIEEGRRTFINTLKYVYIATSGNFGNMFSMGGISFFLNFLPLLPKQVLLNNFFSDLPEMALATDRVDYELVTRPVKWDLPRIRRFMVLFGLISSIPDYLTFGVLLFWFNANETLFQSGWFIESVISIAVIVLAIRTRRSLFRSKPGRLLAFACLAVVIGIPFLPYTPLGRLFGFEPLPFSFYIPLTAILAIYVVLVEIGKKFFFHKKLASIVGK